VASKPELPKGVALDGDKLKVDLSVCEALQHKDGVLEVRPLRLLLVRGKKKVRAFHAECPHKPKKGYRIHQLKREARPVFRCPKHQWTWDRKGRPTGKAKKRLPRLETEQDGDALCVELLRAQLRTRR